MEKFTRVTERAFSCFLNFKMTLVFLFAFLSSIGMMGQVSVVASTGTTSGSYSTVNAAFTNINNGTHKGIITITVTANTTEPATPVQLLASGTGSSSYTGITIKPGSAGIVMSGSAASGRGILELVGADNVTIDGSSNGTSSKDLTIQRATSTTTYQSVIRVSSNSTSGANGADNITIKNCNIIGSRSSASESNGYSFGIVFVDGTAAMATSTPTGNYSSLNTIIQNNTITRVWNAIYAAGASATYPNTGLQIVGNIIGSATSANNIGLRGIFLSYTAASSGGAIIEGNDIRVGDYTSGGGYSSTIAGIEVGTSNYGFIIRKNNIHDINQPSTNGWGAHGIYVTGSTNNTSSTIENNFIRDVKMYIYQTSSSSIYVPAGVFFNAGVTGVNFNHNTIVMNTQLATSTVYSSFCINVVAAGVRFNTFYNNILVNNHTSTAAYGFYTASTANISGGSVNNNNYYVPGGNVGYYNSANQTFASWKTSTGKDAAAQNANPPFVSSTDLHLNTSGATISSFEQQGSASAGVTTDIDGDVRPNAGTTNPDIGADEVVVLVCSKPTSLAGTVTPTVTGSTTISGSFTAAGSPVPYGYVVVRSTSNTLPTLTDGTTYTVGANNTIATNGYVEYIGTSAGSWTSTGLSNNTQYYYYVFSYNAVTCSSGPKYSASATTASATTLACPTFSSVISIGGSTTTPGSVYPTLTAAIADLSGCGITQPTVLSLNSSYNSSSETFPILIPSIAGSSTTNTITIKPASGVTASITGSLASGPLITINGASNIIIDGSNTVGGTTKNLTISNTSTTSPNVVLIGSPNTTPVSNVTVKNTILTNGANTASAILISSSAVAGDPGYFNNVTIKNNTINKAYIGVYVSGNTVANNGDGLLIDSNTLNSSGTNSIRLIGVYVQGVDGNSTISNNLIGNMSNANSETINGIWLATGVNKANVSGNTISGIASTVSGTNSVMGIFVTTGAGTSFVNINNNNISSISSVGTTYVDTVSGIYVSGATPNVNIYSNSVSNVKNTSTTAYTSSGILLGSSSTSSNISVYNNMMWDVAAYGSSTAWRNGFGITVIDGAGYKLYFNSVNMATNQTTAGISAAMYVDNGISTAGGLDIRNNIFNNAQTTGTRYAFYSAAANTVYGNIDYNDYYSTGSVGYLSSARATLANWQTATGKDANSLNVLPVFMSASNLHLNSCTVLESAGTPISEITSDIDGESRSASKPDLGADEFNGTVPPTIASVVNGSNCGTGTVVLTANGASVGSAITGYNWYSASSGGTLIGNSSTSSWTTPSISSTTNYYVVAVVGTCESTTRTLVTATINPSPTDITAIAETQKSSTTITSACDVDYVELNSNGGVVAGITSTVNSGTVNLAIPDNNLATGVLQTLSVSGISANATITKVEVKLNIAHTYDSDLRINLEAPNGKIVNLVNQAGSSGANFTNTIVTSDTTSPAFSTGTAPLTGTFRADLASQATIGTTPAVNSTLFSDLFTTPNGSWKVRVYDDANLDTGTLVDCSITLTYSAPQVTWSPATGLYTDTALTTPYNGTDYLSTVYAAPTTATVYTAKAKIGTCEKSNVTSSIVRTRNEYVGAGTDWATASNWFPNAVPDANKCANIPSGKTVVVSNDALAKSIKIASTGKLTINSGKSLTVTDGIDISNNVTNDNLVLESDASLLQINNVANTGNIYAKRDVKMRKMDYTFWSSPVTGQPLRNTGGTTNPNTYNTGGFSEGTPNNRIYYYDEPTDYFKMTTDVNFVPGKGYAIRGKDSYLPDGDIVSDTSLKFIGVPNNGNSLSVGIQKSKNGGTIGSPIEHGYNLIGNPYPSNLDFISFYNFDQGGGVYNRSNIYGKAWFWTNTSPVQTQTGSSYSGSNYAVLSLAGAVAATGVDNGNTTGSPTPTQYIKVGQGFIVQMRGTAPTGSTPNTATLKFDNSMRSNAAGVFYNNNKSGSPENRYWLKLISPENVSNMILIAHMADATNNYDADYDADLLTIGDDSFYSKLSAQKLQIQARAVFDNQDVIPLGTKYSMNGNYKIVLSGKEGIFSSTQKIYLHDKLLNTYIDLASDDYSFVANKGLDETRFELVYKNQEVLGVGSSSKSDFVVYKDGAFYVVNSSKKLGKIEMYDTSGRLIKSLSTTETTMRIDMNDVASGVYVLKVENSGATKTHKIIK